jgi:hypothetical protein
MHGEQHTLQPDMQEHIHDEPHGAQVDGTQVLGVHPVGNPPHGIQVDGPHTGVSTEGRHVDGVHPSGSEPPHGMHGEHGTQGLQTPHKSTQQGVQKPQESIQRPHVIPSITPCVAVLITAPFKAAPRHPVSINLSVPLTKGIN